MVTQKKPLSQDIEGSSLSCKSPALVGFFAIFSTLLTSCGNVEFASSPAEKKLDQLAGSQMASDDALAGHTNDDANDQDDPNVDPYIDPDTEADPPILADNPDEETPEPPVDDSEEIPVPNPVKKPSIKTTQQGRFTVSNFIENNLYLAGQDIINAQFLLTSPGTSTLNFQQNTRPTYTQTFVQGASESQAQESFDITNLRLLDLLIVVDDSGSMQEEQDKLAARLPALLTYIDDTDWQIAVVTTSSSCLAENRVIKSSDTDRVAAYQDLIKRGVSGSYIEKGVINAIKGLKGECGSETTPWLRPNSSVGVLIISDEDNCGSDIAEDCFGEPGENPLELVQYLQSIRPDGNARTYGIIRPTGDNICAPYDPDDMFDVPLDAFEAPDYQSIIEATQGTLGSICSNDYSDTLKAISENASSIINRSVTLENEPVDGSVEVLISGQKIADGYTLDDRQLTIVSDQHIPQGTSSMQVSYLYGSSTLRDSVATFKEADSESLTITSNQQVVDKSKYSYDEGSKTITFLEVPEDGSKLEILYKEKGQMPLSFFLSKQLPQNTFNLVQVLIDDVLVEEDKVSWSNQSGELTFSSAPPEGSNVEVTLKGHAQTCHNLDDIFSKLPDKIESISAMDTESAQEILMTRNEKMVCFDKSDVWEGRSVRITLQEKGSDGDKAKNTYLMLERFPDAKTLKFKVKNDPSNNNIQKCLKDYALKGNEIQFNCSLPSGSTLTYSYNTPIDNYYEVLKDPYLSYKISQAIVKIDGETLDSFSLNDGWLILSEDQLQHNSVVEYTLELTKD